MKKGIVLGETPPEYQALQPKVQAVMMQKMQLAREAERAEGSKLAAGNKAKGKEFHRNGLKFLDPARLVEGLINTETWP